jgi:acid phosphatase class B
MIHTRRYVNKAKYAPKSTDSLKPLDVAELLKEEIDRGNIPFEIVSEATGIPKKRVERIYYNDLPKEDEMRRILEWVGKRNE